MDKLHLSVEIDTNQLDAAIEKVNRLQRIQEPNIPGFMQIRKEMLDCLSGVNRQKGSLTYNQAVEMLDYMKGYIGDCCSFRL